MQEETLSGYLAVVPAIVGDMDKRLKAMLEEHGCTIETDDNRYIVTYPPGTIKQQIFPMVRDYRYRLMLPDKFEVREVETRGGKVAVYAVLNKLPPDV